VRRAVLATALLLLVLPGCASRERPEGIVERWLLALNQGPAGEPERFAPDRLSERILPDWRHLEPGELDVIEVQPAALRICRTASGDTSCPEGTRIADVPFNIERTDGRASHFEATLVVRGDTWRAEELTSVDHPSSLRVAGWQLTIGLSSWFLAIAVGFALLLVAEGAMRFGRRHATDWSEPFPGREPPRR
jgi:hypothetical protein